CARAIAEEWVPIRPGPAGAFLLALCRELIELGLYDREFLARYTNAGQLVHVDAAAEDAGMLVRGPMLPLSPYRAPEHVRDATWWDRHTNTPVPWHIDGADPFLYGSFTLPDGRPVNPALQLLRER